MRNWGMRSFGDLEARIMAVVWESAEPITVHRVVDALEPEHRVAYTTAITVIERLRLKGWLDRERRGRSFFYFATQAEAEYTAFLMGQVLDESTDRSAALLSFTGALSSAELDALRAALDRADASRPA